MTLTLIERQLWSLYAPNYGPPDDPPPDDPPVDPPPDDPEPEG